MGRVDWARGYTPAKVKELCAILVVDPKTQGPGLLKELKAAGTTFLGASATGLYVEARPGPVRKRFSATLKAAEKLSKELQELQSHPPAFFHLAQIANKTEPLHIAGYARIEITEPKDPSNPAGECRTREETDPVYTTSPARLMRDLPLFKQTLTIGLTVLETDEGGPTPNLELRVYIYFLVKIYEKYAGVSARKNLTTDKKSGEFSGPFYDFTKLNLDIVKPGHGKTNLALARQIRTVLDEPPLPTHPG